MTGRTSCGSWTRSVSWGSFPTVLGFAATLAQLLRRQVRKSRGPPFCSEIFSFTGTRHFSGHWFFQFQGKSLLLPECCLIQQNSWTKVVHLRKVPLMVFSPKFRAHTWLFMNFQTWSKTRTKQFRTAVCEPSYTKIEKWLIFVRNQWKYDKHKEGDEQGLRYLFPSVQVQLSHIRG